jgi:oligopeptide/dipeptide ABC transporter ATP-binding protein
VSVNVRRYINDRVAAMYLRRIVEVTGRRRIFSAAEHPYTRALLSAIPIRHTRVVLTGDVPSPVNPPSGRPFHPRSRDRAPRGAPPPRDGAAVYS